jgi:predicted metal-dependent enzyme (double-stranded beta helix superfamily)
MESECSSVAALITAMNAFVAQTTDPHACVAFVQRTLPALLRTPHGLAPEYTVPATASYARHLVYRHPQGQYTVVAMVWRPGQGTPIHDHGGVWCVEGVYQGQMQVTQYNVTPIDTRHATAVPVQHITANLGNVGALIPPYEYHVMANTSPEMAITLHVYGAELQHCHVFVDAGDGTYRIEERELRYTSVDRAA